MLKAQAGANLSRLSKISYPGCGFVVGLDETGECLIQVNWIMGTDECGRNRVFAQDGSRLFIEVANPSGAKVPASLIYNAMCEVRHNVTYAVVGSDRHVDEVTDGYGEDQGMEHTMHWKDYKPDVHHTPRITAACYWLRDRPAIRMSLVRKSPWSGLSDRHLYEINDVGREFGYCLTTYTGNGDPLSSFEGEPYLMPLEGGAGKLVATYWDALNRVNRVSLAVKFIPKQGNSSIVIVNKNQKV
ncbi:MAG: IMP cyclohydrolase [bacterium]|nr:IMP cyclohydrolase [bacterium]